MRECHRNYAHGPMKLRTSTVECSFRGEIFTCEKTVYACDHCDFELHLEWMQQKLQEGLEDAYQKRHPAP